jgi:hypothetical protein
VVPGSYQLDLWHLEKLGVALTQATSQVGFKPNLVGFALYETATTSDGICHDS